MKNNISEELKEALINFRELRKENKIYLMSILLNHLDNGLINEGNYSNSGEAYENGKLVLEPFSLNLENIRALATQLLIIGTNLEGIVLEPNGIDIEPFIIDNRNPLIILFLDVLNQKNITNYKCLLSIALLKIIVNNNCHYFYFWKT